MKPRIQELAGGEALRRNGAATRAHARREIVWAWLSLATLVLCWDASQRLDAKVSPPRVRIAHAGEREDRASIPLPEGREQGEGSFRTR